MIISFPTKPYLVITSATVTETRRITCDGEARVRHDPPILTYCIDYKDADGFSCCVWDGRTYADALAAALIWANEGVAVRDHTSEAGGRT